MTSCLLFWKVPFPGTNTMIHNVNMPCLSLQLAATAKSCRPHNRQLHSLNVNVLKHLICTMLTSANLTRMDTRGLPSIVKLAIRRHLMPKFLERYLHFLPYFLRGGADKSLARPTSRCRRKESIVSLERGVCSCAELQVFSCYVCLLCLVQRMKGSMSGDARYFNNIETRAVIKFFPPCNARRRRKFMPF